MVNIVLLGSEGVGKSAFAKQFANKKFKEGEGLMTIGVDSKSEDVHANGTMHRVILWDTSCASNWESMLPSYLKHADAVFVLFDTCHALMRAERYIDISRSICDAEVFLIQTKTDLNNDVDGWDTALRHRVTILKTSSTNRDTVVAAISAAVEHITTMPIQHMSDTIAVEEAPIETSCCICQ